MHLRSPCPDDGGIRPDPVRRAVFIVCVSLILAPSLAAIVGMLING